MQVFVFPGQGSQFRGMGGAWFDEFKEITRQADRILGYSIKELCLENPRGELNRTQFTQPALYVVNALSYMKKLRETGASPDYLAGHSLGELNALLAAGCFDFETGLELVRKRGELMSQAGEGAMAAILNATREELETRLRSNGLLNVDIANYNTPSQIVLSGATDEIRKVETLMTGNMIYHPLNTSGAFHSRFMAPAAQEFRSYLESFTFADPKIPVIANVTARPYESGAVTENLARQISSTVRWCESVQYLLQLGSGDHSVIQIDELGNGDVLTKLLRTIKQQSVSVAPSAMSASPPKTPYVVQTARRPARTGASERVREWNSKHGIGIRVKATVPQYDGAQLETRTEAVVLFGHRAAVYMKGYNGYFDLDEVRPL
jgi:malonyl CoA-acyl carrier protein transacylase